MPGMSAEIKALVERCSVCAAFKTKNACELNAVPPGPEQIVEQSSHGFVQHKWEELSDSR